MSKMVCIEESGVAFGPFDISRCFLIEQSETVKALKQGIKIVEFTYYSPENKFFVVEAKSTIPKKNTNESKYQDFFRNIVEKFENSLTIHAMHTLGRNAHMKNEAPALMQNLCWEDLSIQLRLVIPAVPTEYCPPLTDKLKQELSKLKKLWGISEFGIKVINAELASQEGLITSNT